MAIPTYVGNGGEAFGTGDVTPALPSGWQADDIFLLQVEHSDATIGDISGWTKIVTQTNGSSGSTASFQTWYWRRATASESNPTVPDPGNHLECVVHAFRGCITSGDPWNIQYSGEDATGTTGITVPGNTTTVADCLIVVGVGQHNDTNVHSVSSPSNGDLANLSVQWADGTNQGDGGCIALLTGEKAAAGTFGNTTATASNSAGRKSYVVFALKPPAGGGAITVQAVGDIASAEAFGDQRAQLIAKASGLASQETLGEARAVRQLAAAGSVASEEAFGQPLLWFVVDAFGTPKAVLLVKGEAVASAEAVGEPTVVTADTGIVIRAAGAIASAETVGEPNLLRLLYPAALTGEEAFGDQRAIRLLTAAGAILTEETVAAPKTIRLIRTDGLTSLEAFGGPYLTSPQYVYAAGAISSLEQLGEPRPVRILSTLGLGSGEAFGQETLLSPIYTIRAVGQIASLEGVGEPRVLFVIRPDGLASGEQIGEPVLPQFATDIIVVRAVGDIGSLETFGDQRLARILQAAGAVASAEQLGAPFLTSPQYLRAVGAIGSGETHGTATAVRIMRAAAVASGETVSAPQTLRLLTPAAVAGAETLGIPAALRLVFPAHIATLEQVGVPIHVGDPILETAIAFGAVLLTDGNIYDLYVADGDVYAVYTSENGGGSAAVDELGLFKAKLGDSGLGNVRVDDYPGG